MVSVGRGKDLSGRFGGRCLVRLKVLFFLIDAEELYVCCCYSPWTAFKFVMAFLFCLNSLSPFKA